MEMRLPNRKKDGADHSQRAFPRTDLIGFQNYLNENNNYYHLFEGLSAMTFDLLLILTLVHAVLQ